ncbi:AsmA-like C-terminal region-containing protein [Capnocytophaga canis]|uniref:AsmA-like C-terminal region-containing protein n=1 Tax=Capnocytophaga canis TaxID=1848903 RepID=UPI00370DAC84
MKIVKKLLKITVIFVVLLVLAMVAIPFFFKDKIKEKAISLVNENINATASLEDVSLSLFRSFPKADVTLTNFSIVNKEPFVGDTLFTAQKIAVKVSVTDLLSGNYNILGFDLKDASVFIHMNKEGQGNFDIALPSETTQKESQSTPFKLGIQSYNIENMKFTFKNDDGDMHLLLDELNHTGKGNFENEVLDLNTKTDLKISFSMDKSNFMNRIPVSLDAILGIDLNQQKYTFKENKAIINRLELVFDGFVKLLENGQHYDLTFNAPSNSFQSFLALIPEAYSKEIEKVKTTGDFTLKGNVKGDMVGDKIPTFAMEMTSQKASLKYPDLPKSIQNINIDLKVKNTTGIMNDTQVNLDKFTMTIDEDHFTAKAHVYNVVDNPKVNAALKGTVNLANLSQAYPISLDKQLKGIFKADITTELDMNSVEKQKFENVKSQGVASLQQFVYEGEEFVKPFHIDEANLDFSTAHIQLSKFISHVGDSDLKLNGRLDNLFGFLFKNDVLKGNFALNSNKLVIADFMQPATNPIENPTESQSKEVTTASSTTSVLKIPSFLDCTFTANVEMVIYDNLELKNTSGRLIIKEEKVRLENLRTDILGGNVAISGNVSTKDAIPTFAMGLDMSKLNIVEAFTKIEMLSKIAPISKVLQGKINTVINVTGNLKNDMTPDLSTLSGDISAALVDSKVKSEESKLLTSLASNFQSLDFSKLNLKDLKVSGKFKDGKVNINPFKVKYKDVSIDVVGTHGFDQVMDYNVVFNIPPQMLGTEASTTLAKLTGNQTKVDNIAVTALLAGTFDNPKISTDMKQSVANLASQIAKNQINNLKDKGTDALKGFISSKTDSTTAGKANQLIEGLTTKRDSTINKVKDDVKEKAKEEVKNQAKGLLKGIFGDKKEEK